MIVFLVLGIEPFAMINATSHISWFISLWSYSLVKKEVVLFFFTMQIFLSCLREKYTQLKIHSTTFVNNWIWQSRQLFKSTQLNYKKAPKTNVN